MVVRKRGSIKFQLYKKFTTSACTRNIILRTTIGQQFRNKKILKLMVLFFMRTMKVLHIKGPTRFGSIILHYRESVLDKNITELNLFSDNCSGQNENNTVIWFLLALTDTVGYTKITHYFPVRGHSFWLKYQGFGIIKKKWGRVIHVSNFRFLEMMVY